jgi:hypothetical protein
MPGTYVRTDGSVVYLKGREDFWNVAPINMQQGTSSGRICYSGKTIVGESSDAAMRELILGEEAPNDR